MDVRRQRTPMRVDVQLLRLSGLLLARSGPELGIQAILLRRRCHQDGFWLQVLHVQRDIQVSGDQRFLPYHTWKRVYDEDRINIYRIECA